MTEESSEVNKRKEVVKTWLKNPYNLLLVLLMIFTISARLYYFSLTANQPTWWDEGDYLSIAKEIALPSPETPEWLGHFVSIRPPLMPLIWAVFIKFAISEAAMRLFTEVIPSIFIVLLSYLLASSLFNKKIGLITGYAVSIYWVLQFYGYRLLTDIPTVFFALASVYFFWEFYIKRKKPYGLYLSAVLGVMGFLTRFTTFLVILVIAIYLIITERQKILFDKTIWITILIGILSLIPYAIYMKIILGSWFPAASFYLTNNLTTYNTFAWFLLQYVPQFLTTIPFIFVIIGLGYSLFKMGLGADVFFKQKDQSLNRDYFLFIFLFIQIFFYVFWFKTGTDRWILLWFPAIFIYLGLGLEKIGELLNKYSRYSFIILTIIVLVILSYAFIPQADNLIKQKLPSYKDVQSVGLWLKDNTPEDAKIMTASIVQNAYYSHRRSYDFYIGTEIQEQVNNSVLDPQGRVISSTYKTYRNETELECKIVRVKPDYLVLHIWEPEFTPDFMFTYPERNQNILQPIKVFTTQGQTTAIIYKFTGYPSIDISKVNCTGVYERPTLPSGIPLRIVSPERLLIPS
ncbi:MAG: glycosyltransferase family 39 protein [Nanoarchaeota archaeon]